MSLNTALDRTVAVDALCPGAVHAAREEILSAGGKAVNVVRALSALGARARVAGLAGGATGREVRRLAREDGVAARWFALAGDTRVCTILVDATSGATVVNGRGPRVAPGEIQPLFAYVMERARRGDAIVLTGSAPPGVGDDIYLAWGRRLRAAGASAVVLDAHGPLLAKGLGACPDVVKVNRDEFRAVHPGQGIAEGARRLLAGGVGLVVVTMGAEGALAFAAQGAYRALVPPVKAVNATGSGDAFLAGLLAVRLAGGSLVDALQLATAAAARNAGRLAPGLDSREDVERLAHAVAVRELSQDAGAGVRNEPR